MLETEQTRIVSYLCYKAVSLFVSLSVLHVFRVRVRL